MSASARYVSAGVIALAATLALSSAAHATPPLRSRTNVSAEQGEIGINEGAFFFFFNVQRIKSSETHDKESAEMFWNYFDFKTNSSGSGFCTIALSTLSGRVSTKGGNLSLRTDTAPLLVGKDCLFKNGGNMTVNIDWTSDGFSSHYFDGTTRDVTSYPNTPIIISTVNGKMNSGSAQAHVNIVNADIGMLIGTIGYPDGTLGGIATLDEHRDTSRTVEKTPPGTP